MIWKYLWKYKIRYGLGIVTLFVVDSLGLLIPELTGIITDGLDMGTMDYHGVLSTIGLILLVGAGLAIGRFCWRFFLLGAARHVEYEIRNDLFTHLSKLSMRYYNEHKTGDIMAHFTSDINAIRMSIGPAIITTFDAVIMTIMVVTKMIVYVNLRLTLFACIPMVVILVGGILYGRSIEKRFTEKQNAYSDMTDQVQENISGIRVIKAFVQEQKEIMSFAKANENNKEKNLNVVKLQARIMPLLDLMIGISSVIAILYGGKLVVDGAISPGKFVAFNQYILLLVWPMIASGDSITFISQGIASMRRIEEILNEQPEITNQKDMDNSINEIKGDIELRALSFSYDEDKEKVLDNISVKIPQGRTLAIIGATGSGKTTIANLLLRMYDAKDGMILLDGVDIKKIPLAVLREQIAYVPQDNFLFSDTIQTNIAFGVRKLKDIPHKKKRFHLIPTKKEMKEVLSEYDILHKESLVDVAYGDLDKVQEAAKAACIHDNIMEFPRQYGTMVGERGVTISGGQKQRSSIARALMKNASVLILDDALSAVDTNTEEMILRNLKQNRKDKTTIIIAHRISTIQNADHILVIKDGKQIEYGTHAELLAAGNTYAQLYHKQQLEQQLEEA